MTAPVSVVAVTGAAGFIGFNLLQDLEETAALAKLVAIDQKPLPRPLHNIRSHRLDVSGPLTAVFQRDPVDSVVHLAFDLREGRNFREAEAIQRDNLFGLQNLLRECQRAGVRHFLYLSSHTVYGPHADNPVPITEEAEPRPLPGFQYGQTKRLSERILESFAVDHPELEITVLRCCMVLGPTGSSRVASGFQKPALLKTWGLDPPLQFIHVSDLARTLAILATNPKPGVYNLAGDGVIRYSRMAKLIGKRVISLPAWLAFPMVDGLWKLGLQKESRSVGLNFIRRPVIMATGKVKAATGYKFRYSAQETVESYAAATRW